MQKRKKGFARSSQAAFSGCGLVLGTGSAADCDVDAADMPRQVHRMMTIMMCRRHVQHQIHHRQSTALSVGRPMRGVMWVRAHSVPRCEDASPVTKQLEGSKVDRFGIGMMPCPRVAGNGRRNREQRSMDEGCRIARGGGLKGPRRRAIGGAQGPRKPPGSS